MAEKTQFIPEVFNDTYMDGAFRLTCSVGLIATIASFNMETVSHIAIVAGTLLVIFMVARFIALRRGKPVVCNRELSDFIGFFIAFPMTTLTATIATQAIAPELIDITEAYLMDGFFFLMFIPYGYACFKRKSKQA